MRYILLEIIFFLFLACNTPTVLTQFQDSYEVSPTQGQRGSISFSFAGKSAGLDNYIIYYGTKILDDPSLASDDQVSKAVIYTEKDGLTTTIKGLQEGENHYIWVYARANNEVINSLPIQTVYPYTVIKNYQVLNLEGLPEATWNSARGAESYSIFKTANTSTSMLTTDIKGESASLANMGLGNQEESYIIAYDADGDLLAVSDSYTYDIALSLTLNLQAGQFPYSLKLAWRQDVNAETYELISHEVDSTGTLIPSSEHIFNLDASMLLQSEDPSNPRYMLESYLVRNLDINKRYVYQVKGKTSLGEESQLSGKAYGSPRSTWNLSPYTISPPSSPYEIGLSWPREYASLQDLNGNSLSILYDNLRYKVTFTRPTTAPEVGTSIATSFVYSDTANDLAYANSSYNVKVDDSSNVPVYIRDSTGIRVEPYGVKLELIGEEKTSKNEVLLGSYTNSITPVPIVISNLSSQFDGTDKLTLSAPVPTATLKNYYRIRKDSEYDDIPDISTLTPLPADNILDFAPSAPLESLYSERNLPYEVWTTRNGVYINVGAGTANVEVSNNLILSTLADTLPGSVYLSWNTSYTREGVGFTLQQKRTNAPDEAYSWTTVADIDYTATSYTIYDMDLIDEALGNVRINYDIKLVPKTWPKDASTAYSVFPASQLLLETPTQVSMPDDHTPFKVQVSDQQISSGVTTTIGDLTNRDGTTFASHFAGANAPKIRFIVERPSIRPNGVAKTFTQETATFSSGNYQEEFNDVENAIFQDLIAGRAYGNSYNVKYQLVYKSGTPQEQILGESLQLLNVSGGYLNPSFFTGGGDDDLSLTDDDDAKIQPRTFTKLSSNSNNYQIIHYVDSGGHSAIPGKPTDYELENFSTKHQLGGTNQLGDAFPDSASVMRAEATVSTYYVQIYTYRISDDKLIGSKLISYPSTNVLQPMFFYDTSFPAGGTPFKHWYMPYFVDTTTDIRYYFYDWGYRPPNSSGLAFVPLEWFDNFNIHIAIFPQVGTGFEGNYRIKKGQKVTDMVNFFEEFNHGDPVFPTPQYGGISLHLSDYGSPVAGGIVFAKWVRHYNNADTIKYETVEPSNYNYSRY